MDVFTQSSVIGGDDGDLPSLVDEVRSGKPAALETAGPSMLRMLAATGRSIRFKVRRDGRTLDIDVKPRLTIE